ncbi:TIGR01244 family phosphatase [bacterium]|nr:TIGR01244 family phosphatase [bacterium]
MVDFKRVTADFAVAPQITADDLQGLAQAGFRRIINNRPDGEERGQAAHDDMRRLAADAGLDYVYAPFQGAPTPEAITAVDAAVKAGGATLAHCRSGTRSVIAWSMAEVRAGRRSPRDVVELARGAGYDLSPHLGALERLTRA